MKAWRMRLKSCSGDVRECTRRFQTVRNRTFVLAGCIAAVASVHGCWYRVPDQRVPVAEDQCKRLAYRVPGYPEAVRDRARACLARWQNGCLDPVPILMHAEYVFEAKEGRLALILHISDEDFNVVGFGVLERHIARDGVTELIEEEFPVFVRYSCGLREKLRFYRRAWSGQRNSKIDWTTYRKTGTYPEDLPPIHISVPRNGEVDVDVWVFDADGNKSGLVPLLPAPGSDPFWIDEQHTESEPSAGKERNKLALPSSPSVN